MSNEPIIVPAESSLGQFIDALRADRVAQQEARVRLRSALERIEGRTGEASAVTLAEAREIAAEALIKDRA